MKLRHEIRHLQICGKRASTDKEASEYFVDELKKTIRDEQIPYELVYNVDETSLFAKKEICSETLKNVWRYLLPKIMFNDSTKTINAILKNFAFPKRNLLFLNC